ncbi:phosphate ABC transporter ATP-binding protein (PhoT family) [Mesocricetibacter intestinalis]|uniref:Phosphate ABC transporter ATP-binding protein (PhoT family) n=1 Tax=Mesocricetibacter intestinalis TaxID=1521930 RepID=A0A4R6VFH5_9PAST|nr:ATP-binding cassette domain-containing protein [Mesocricetibacter intestinalis]TDQ59745.1 phosphate ABC transporter ATP-binding protein (PhoT family) [Mesocricetibacter intestinalis]
MTIAAQLSRLSIKFHRHSILENINLTIPKNKITVFIGRSGSGKTTLLRSFNRLNDEYPECLTEGEIKLDLGTGLQLYNRLSPKALSELRLKVGILFQTPNVLPVSIEKNISLPLAKLLHLAEAEIRDRVQQSLQDVGLWEEVRHRLHSAADKLSGGQQQRLCLARILALKPKILLLDEPTASLDILAARKIEELIEKLAPKYSLIMVSHSLAQACRLADRLCIFDKGRIIAIIDNKQEMQEEKLAGIISALPE